MDFEAAKCREILGSNCNIWDLSLCWGMRFYYGVYSNLDSPITIANFCGVVTLSLYHFFFFFLKSNDNFIDIERPRSVILAQLQSKLLY